MRVYVCVCIVFSSLLYKNIPVINNPHKRKVVNVTISANYIPKKFLRVKRSSARGAIYKAAT